MTLMQLLSSMDSVMPVETSTSAELLGTQFTLIWLPSSVDSEMCLKRSTFTKLLVTQFTLIGLLSSMDSEMRLKVPTCTKLIVTQMTLMRLLSTVDEEMSLQFTGGGEVLAADSALQWLRVEPAMPSQPILGLVGVAALLTLQATGACIFGEAHDDHGSSCLHGVKKLIPSQNAVKKIYISEFIMVN